MKNLIEEISKVYCLLEDEMSKKLFEQRLLYNITKRPKYIANMVDIVYHSRLSVVDDAIFSFLKQGQEEKKKIIIYGAGNNGAILFEFLKLQGISASYFCDQAKEKQGKIYYGLPVLSIEKLKDYPQAQIVISVQNDWNHSIEDNLISLGLEEKNIMRFYPIWKTEYFDTEIVTPEKEECYIDAGCFDGQTVKDFLQWCHNEYVFIYAFEPDKNCFQICQRHLNQLDKDKFSLIPKGLWSHKTELSFSENENGTSTIEETGTNIIKTISLDEHLQGKKVTFIKMDIEGAELEALKGAKETIQKYHPKLAICIYHKEEDIIEIPLYIKRLVPEYRFYIRHYQPYCCETVLYAVMEKIEEGDKQ